jgi:hypothetical protein
MILGIFPGENYFDTRALANIVAMCLHKCQHFVGRISKNKWKIHRTKEKVESRKNISKIRK